MRLLRTCIYVLIIASVTFLCGEGVVRIYYRLNPHHFISSYYLFTYNKFFGNWHNPHVDMQWTKEGSGHVRTNSHGMIGKDCFLEKAPRVYRIAILGDSFTEGLQVDYNKNFCALLEDALNQSLPDDQQIEVLNFGISGQGTTQSYVLLEKMALSFDPDLVILGFFPGNDVHNNSRELQKDTLRPYYTIGEDGTIVRDEEAQVLFESFIDSRTASVRYKVINAVRNRSYFATYILQFIKSCMAGEIQFPRAQVSEARVMKRVPLYEVPVRSVYERAWNITETMLVNMQNLCMENGIDFFVLQISRSHEVNRYTSKNYMRAFPEDDINYPSKRIRAFCAQKNIDLVQLTDYFLSLSEQNPSIYFHGYEGAERAGGHWNESGHRYCADALTDYILSEDVIDR